MAGSIREDTRNPTYLMMLDSEHRFHQKRLRQMKPVLQVRPPAKFTHLDKKNVKQKKERDREILSDNELLLNKILHIMNNRQQKLQHDHNKVLMSLNYLVRKNEVRKVNEGNEILLKQLREAQPTLRHDEWVTHERRVDVIKQNLAGKHMMLPVLAHHLRPAHNRSRISEMTNSRGIDLEQTSIETLNQQSISPAHNGSTRMDRSFGGWNNSSAQRNSSKMRRPILHRRNVTTGGSGSQRRGPRFESSDRQLLKNILADDLIKKYNAAELEKVFNQFHSEQFYARFRQGKRASQNTHSSSGTGSALTALQMQEIINQNRPGMFSQGGERSPRYQVRASSQSPNARQRMDPSSFFNSRSQRPPATAIGSQRTAAANALFPISPSSFDSSNQMSTVSKTITKTSKYKPTSPSNQSFISSNSQSPSTGYPKNHLQPKSTPGLTVPLRNQQPTHGNLLQNWPIKEARRKTSIESKERQTVGVSSSKHSAQERDSIVSRGSEPPRVKTSSGPRPKNSLPLAKRIVSQKARGGKVKIEPPLAPVFPQNIQARKKSPPKVDYPNRKVLIGSGRINTHLLERVSPKRGTKKTSSTPAKMKKRDLVINPDSIPVKSLNQIEVNSGMLHNEKISTPVPDSSDNLSDFKDMHLNEQEAENFLIQKKDSGVEENKKAQESATDQSVTRDTTAQLRSGDQTNIYSQRQDFYAQQYQNNNPLIKVEEKEETDEGEYFEDESRNNSSMGSPNQPDYRKDSITEIKRNLNYEEEKQEHVVRTEGENTQPRSPQIIETGRTEFSSVDTPELNRYEEELKKLENQASSRAQNSSNTYRASEGVTKEGSTSKLSEGGGQSYGVSDDTNTINDPNVLRMKRNSTDLLIKESELYSTVQKLEGQPIPYEQVDQEEYKQEVVQLPQSNRAGSIQLSDAPTPSPKHEAKQKTFAAQPSFQIEAQDLQQIDETSEENILSSLQTRNETPMGMNVQSAHHGTQHTFQSSPRDSTLKHKIDSQPVQPSNDSLQPEMVEEQEVKDQGQTSRPQIPQIQDILKTQKSEKKEDSKDQQNAREIGESQKVEENAIIKKEKEEENLKMEDTGAVKELELNEYEL